MNAATFAPAAQDTKLKAGIPGLDLLMPVPYGSQEQITGAALAVRSPPLSVVVAYEDAGTRERAVQVCQGTLGKRWCGLDFQCSWWRFDLLEHPAVAQAAVEAAAKADLFVCSVHAENELPAVVKAWVEKWLPGQSGREGALIVLVESTRTERGVRAPAVSYLQRVASEAGMTFFVRFFDTPDGLAGCSAETICQRANAVTGVLSEILSYRGGFPHGGINE